MSLARWFGKYFLALVTIMGTLGLLALSLLWLVLVSSWLVVLSLLWLRLEIVKATVEVILDSSWNRERIVE